MANDNKAQATEVKKPGPNVEAMQAGRAAAKAKRAEGPVLDPRQKFVLSTVRQAAKACKLLIAEAESGKAISSDAVSACNALSTEFARLMG